MNGHVYMHAYARVHISIRTFNMYKSTFCFLNTREGLLGFPGKNSILCLLPSHTHSETQGVHFTHLNWVLLGPLGPGLSIQQYRLIPPASSQSHWRRSEVGVGREEERQRRTQKSQVQTSQAEDMSHVPWKA